VANEIPEQEGTSVSVLIDAARFGAVVFDLDGVLTDTARLHQMAWKRTFDEALGAMEGPIDRRPFDGEDYRRYVDGRARVDGVEAFLDSRGSRLPRGLADDVPGATTAWALANRKNEHFLVALATDGVRAFPSSVTLVGRLRAAGLVTAVVTASQNRAEVLAAARIDDLFDVHVDGLDAAALGLAGKPDPAMFLEAARRLGVGPVNAVVVEDALAGVTAGARGGFGLVIGVDRTGDPRSLAAAGADLVVSDLSEVDVKGTRGGTGR
jgi:beta-phosphoglucomutase family hydrolase